MALHLHSPVCSRYNNRQTGTVKGLVMNERGSGRTGTDTEIWIQWDGGALERVGEGDVVELAVDRPPCEDAGRRKT
jgi:hypothetical protein